MKYVLFMVLAICLSSCKAEPTDVIDMESSERQFNERMRQELVISMSLENLFSDRGVRALAKAAGQGKIDEIEELVAQGVEVNSQGTKGVTPLFWALRKSSLEGFEKLLDLGANPNITFADSSVMHWAARHDDIRFLQKALKYGGNANLMAGEPSETPLFVTIGVKGAGNEEAMYVLLDAGADINAETGGEEVYGMSMGGITPVLAAADVVRYDIVYELLQRGADYQVKDDSGQGLTDRIESVHGRFPSGSDSASDLANVIDWLLSHGVEVPSSAEN